MSGSNMELHIQPVTSGMSGTHIDPNVNADDSDRGPYQYPDVRGISSYKAEVAKDDASI